MKKSILIVVFVAFALTGCDRFLEIYPETSLSSNTFFKTESDFEQAVNGAYAPLRNIVNDHAWLLGEMHSDNTYFDKNPLYGNAQQQEEIGDFAVPSVGGITANSHVRSQYQLDYQIISRANQILDLIDAADFDTAAKNNLKGQALFLRAYAYFELVRYFGSVPLHLEPVVDREGTALPLSSEADIYAQIIADLEQSIPLLPLKSQQEPGRVTTGAASTLLASVYMVQKQWHEAEVLLKDVVDSKEYQLMTPYANVFSTNTGNKNNAESVFEIQFKEGADGVSGNFLYLFMPRPMTAGELQPITGTVNPQPLGDEGNNIPTPDIIAAYENGDERKEASIDYVTLSSSQWLDGRYPYIKKFAKPHSQHGNHGMNWPVYRYAEVLLFLAEALNEQGNPQEAAIYLDQVRHRAGLDGTQATSTEEMRTAIYKERRVELAFEDKRWFDLVRTGRIEEVIVPYGNRIKAHPIDYYYPEGEQIRSNAFTNLEAHYPLPDDESALSPYF